MTRETVGKLSTELSQKAPDTQDPIELQREMHKQYESQLLTALDSGRKQFAHDFYLVVLYKKERLMPNVIRAYFFARESCPTPEYDQTVYHYTRVGDTIEFLWVIPSKDTCELLRDNALQVQEKELLHFVLEFYDGTLDKRAQLLNKEIV